MKRPLRLLVLGATTLLGLPVLAAFLLGLATPSEHQLRLAMKTQQGPAAVWPVVSNWEHQPEWRPSVASVEGLEPVGGRPAWRILDQDGDATEVAMIAWNPPLAFTWRVESERFSGTWTVELVREGLGTGIILTERGRIPNPLVRLVAHRLGSLDAEAEGWLLDLAKKLGEKPVLIRDSAGVAALGKDQAPPPPGF